MMSILVALWTIMQFIAILVVVATAYAVAIRL